MVNHAKLYLLVSSLSFAFDFASVVSSGRVLQAVHQVRTDLAPVLAFAQSHPCQGAEFQWNLGSPYLTYPFPIHDPACSLKPGYILLSIDPQSSVVRVRSLRCSGTSPNVSTPCSSCLGVRVHVDVKQDHATKPPGKLDRATLSHQQIVTKLGELEMLVQEERLKVRTFSAPYSERVTNVLPVAQCISSTRSPSFS